MSSPRYAWAVRAALAVYCLWAALFILAGPGLQYDEALLVLGGVQMRQSPLELPLPHDVNTWVCPVERCFPLMTARYVGAVKDYLALPVFAAFGTSAASVRCVSAFLGLLGIWGLARLITFGVNPAAGAVAAWLLALNPAYVDLTVFDNGTVSVWMGAMGLLCAAIALHLRRQSRMSAFLVGVCAGLGIWARANFLWLVLAMFAAALLVWGTRVLRPLVYLCLGGIVGGFPFLWYQVVSNGGTWQAVAIFSAGDRSLHGRVIAFCETLLSDQEHRDIWNGPPALPFWQHYLFPAILLAACVSVRNRWGLAFVITLLGLGGAFFSSRLPVAEHHLITLVPIAVGIVAIASQRFPRTAAMLGILYLGCALYWQISAVRGIERTRGVGEWSDGITRVAQELKKRGREVTVLDWGLQNNIFVLSDGSVKSHEVIWRANDTPLFHAESLAPLLKSGGLFVMNGPTNRMMPDASVAFLAGLDRERPVVERVTIPQRSGAAFAQIVDVRPDTLGQGEVSSAFDLKDDKQVEGAYGLEANRYRWMKKNFRVWLKGGGTQLVLSFYLPVADNTAISVKLGERAVCSQTFVQAGAGTLNCAVNPAWLNGAGQWFDFAVDKAQPAAPPDTRELGLILSGAALE